MTKGKPTKPKAKRQPSVRHLMREPKRVSRQSPSAKRESRQRKRSGPRTDSIGSYKAATCQCSTR